VAPRLLAPGREALVGRLLSGDALYGQQACSRQVTAAGGWYLWAVKANQPELLADILLLFADPPPGERFLGARTVTKHAGRLEERRRRASAALADYLQAAGWVGAGLVLEVTTTVRWPAHPERPTPQEVRHFLRSLPALTPAGVALAAVRRHWTIENRRHWPRDLMLGEDACRVRSGQAPQALAAVRNGVLAVLRSAHLPNLAAALRTNAWSSPGVLLSFLGLSLS
jgi:hypothetical protein